MAVHLYQAQDTDEYCHDTDAEQWANSELNGVIGGCALTYSASTMAVTMGAGTIVANGLVVQVAADATGVTLVADSSNPRWATIGLNTSGVMVLASGSAATTPAKPELATIQVVLAVVKVDAGLTIATNASVQLDKRIPIRSFAIRKTADETVNTSATLQNDDSFYFYMNASESWQVELDLAMNSGATPDFKAAWTVQAGGSAVGTKVVAAGTRSWVTDFTAAEAYDGTGANSSIGMKLALVNSTTAGLFRLQWAQNTSDASDTKLLINSLMVARRVT